MLIFSLCPKCQTEHELSRNLLGKSVYCQKCTAPFVVTETTKVETTIGVQSAFAAAELPEETSASTGAKNRPKMRLTPEGTFNLVLPPPPLERWSDRTSAKDESERFREFRHDSRDIDDFLERERGSDYSGLLIAGMTFCTVLVFTFFILLLCLIIFAR